MLVSSTDCSDKDRSHALRTLVLRLESSELWDTDAHVTIHTYSAKIATSLHQKYKQYGQKLL